MHLCSWIQRALGRRSLVRFVALALAFASVAAFGQRPGGLPLETGFAPTQDLTVWPLQISQGYPMVRGQVGDVAGYFMLDTGTPWGLLLNRGRVTLPDTRFVLTATSGSGQSFEVVQAAQMPPVVLHGQTWAQVRSVQAADLGFFERGTGIGPFLGFIGANFLADTVLPLDYARRVAVIRRVRPDTGAPLAELPPGMSGGPVLATVAYRGDAPSFPVFDALVGATPVRVMLDSGNPGATFDAGWLAELRSAGAAQAFSQIDAETTYRTVPLQIGALTVPMQDAVASDEPLKVAGQAEPRLVKLGYTLLNRYGVTWNYRLQTMSFFAP